MKGVGVTSKEPVVGKKSTAVGKVHMATHFGVGCDHWDEAPARHRSVSHQTWTDPGVVYGTRDAPDKNRSVVDLRQRVHDPEVHYRTEQKERFADNGPQPIEQAFDYSRVRQVHLGNDKPELITQTAMAHFKPADAEAKRSASLRAAGSGLLISTSLFPKPPRVNPVMAGPRTLDAHDLGIAKGFHWNRPTQNVSTIIEEPNVRNPVLGHHILASDYGKPANPMAFTRTSGHAVKEANARVPYLRSLGAVRPHE
eukprot:CAMPEP_0178459500 /NCGR_PEP_ID=MMETSP0689_2-20121128/48165_1 /TAXON_ID=160604 /ORGANISM="Amphidinium massartii, Strain CS-259" /LENGTH=253 /DNA_ID=CAMNT_0020085985 /DNA_START=72 /DNA_END=830 /DNA_ORIENTATION=-